MFTSGCPTLADRHVFGSVWSALELLISGDRSPFARYILARQAGMRPIPSAGSSRPILAQDPVFTRTIAGEPRRFEASRADDTEFPGGTMKTLRFGLALFAAAAIGIPSQLGAQTTLGVKGGIGITDLSFESSEGGLSSRTTFTGGGFAQFMLGEQFFIQPEVLYAPKGAKESEFGAEVTIGLDYIEIPLLFGAEFGVGQGLTPRVFAGPSVAFEVSCKLSGEFEGISASADCSEEEIETKSVDFGLVFGAGLGIPVGGFEIIIDGRYDLGLTNINDSDLDDGSVKNRAWQFMAGVGFPVGG